jgi:hypothetical protein
MTKPTLSTNHAVFFVVGGKPNSRIAASVSDSPAFAFSSMNRRCSYVSRRFKRWFFGSMVGRPGPRFLRRETFSIVASMFSPTISSIKEIGDTKFLLGFLFCDTKRLTSARSARDNPRPLIHSCSRKGLPEGGNTP